MNRTDSSKKVLVLRVDEIPLLYSVIVEYRIVELVEKYVEVHGNWVGSLPSNLLSVWLCYLLQERDHRLSSVEEWVEERLELFQVLTKDKNLRSVDFSDDKLGYLLDLFSQDAVWQSIERDVNGSLLGVYRLNESKDSILPTIRLDAAPMQGYGKVSPKGLLQYGHHKHHANLPQFKIKLCTLDNTLNNFAYPLCHLTVSGNQADDVLYIDAIKNVKAVLKDFPTYESGNLYVGDSKLGSIGNRSYIVDNKEYYLLPLSLIQLSKEDRRAILKAHIAHKEIRHKVYRKEKGEQILVAEGFERVISLSDERKEAQGTDETVLPSLVEWEERRLFVYSIAYGKVQEKRFDNRLAKGQQKIEKLNIRTQGKKVLQTLEEYQSAVAKILKKSELVDFISVNIKEIKTSKKIRAYGKTPKRIVTTSTFEINCQRNEAEISKHKLTLGWQVYATNTPKEQLSFESCVWKYRYQSNIESRFDDLRNKIVPLLPVYLQKDNRIKGLVNILFLALKICSTIEYKVAKSLKEQNEAIEGLYEGNPRRTTVKPSISRILNAFEGISISLIFINRKFQFALMTELSKKQKKILALMGLSESVYKNLCPYLEIFFSDFIFSET
ncbi:MAG: IS1634 family transposase [Polaribacter sp.]